MVSCPENLSANRSAASNLPARRALTFPCNPNASDGPPLRSGPVADMRATPFLQATFFATRRIHRDMLGVWNRTRIMQNPHGKICYIEIPAIDVHRSSEFYAAVFGWQLRQRGDGAMAFDDASGAVSGTWIVSRPPSATPGLLIYIWCDSVAATIDAILAHGGELVQPIGADAPEITARFRDPAGNVLGLYQSR